MFEFMQGQLFKDWFEQIQVCERVGIYSKLSLCSFIKNGVFDVADIAAIIIGAILAYSIMLLASKKEISR